VPRTLPGSSPYRRRERLGEYRHLHRPDRARLERLVDRLRRDRLAGLGGEFEFDVGARRFAEPTLKRARAADIHSTDADVRGVGAVLGEGKVRTVVKPHALGEHRIDDLLTHQIAVLRDFD
jgi:hypothetical protein